MTREPAGMAIRPADRDVARDARVDTVLDPRPFARERRLDLEADHRRRGNDEFFELGFWRRGRRRPAREPPAPAPPAGRLRAPGPAGRSVAGVCRAPGRPAPPRPRCGSFARAPEPAVRGEARAEEPAAPPSRAPVQGPRRSAAPGVPDGVPTTASVSATGWAAGRPRGRRRLDRGGGDGILPNREIRTACRRRNAAGHQHAGRKDFRIHRGTPGRPPKEQLLCPVVSARNGGNPTIRRRPGFGCAPGGTVPVLRTGPPKASATAAEPGNPVQPIGTRVALKSGLRAR